MTALTRRRALALGALLCAAVAGLLLPGLGAAPLERAEIYFVDAARAMVERGDYLVPYYRGEPFFDKPALTYWLMAGAFRLFGFHLAAARLVPAVAAVLVLATALWLGRTLFGAASSLLGGVVLATTGAFVVFGRIAMSDMLLTLWTLLAVTLAVQAFAHGRAWPWVPLLGAVLGLGFLTKGPVAVLFPGLGIALLCWERRRQRWPLTPGAVLAAGALFAALGLGWFAAVYLRLGAEPLRYFFLRENLQRFAAATYDSGQPFWYYPVTYLAQGLPWSLFLPLVAWNALAPAGSSGEDAARRARVRWLLAWAALMAVPLSLSRGKIDYYLLPLYPVLALALGAQLGREWGRRERVWGRAVAALCAVLLAAVPLVVGVFPADWLPSLLAPMVVLPALAALACALAALRGRPALIVAALAAVSALAFLAAGAVLVPAFAGAQPNAAVSADVGRERSYRPDVNVAVCEDEARVQRAILFQARVAVQQQCDLWAAATSPHPFLLLLREPERASLQPVEGLREVGRYRYLPAQALTFGGLLAGARPAELSLMANFSTADPVAETKRKRDRKRALRPEGYPPREPSPPSP
jgi:4-amino-4-deoxy-L-arabinose transferase-like glycosyltransferase